MLRLAVGLLLLAVTWLVPAVRLVVVWPMLFFVPGWFLLARDWRSRSWPPG